MANIPQVQQDAIDLYNELDDKGFTTKLVMWKVYSEEVAAATIELTVDCSGSETSQAMEIVKKRYNEDKIITESGRLKVQIL